MNSKEEGEADNIQIEADEKPDSKATCYFLSAATEASASEDSTTVPLPRRNYRVFSVHPNLQSVCIHLLSIAIAFGVSRNSFISVNSLKSMTTNSTFYFIAKPVRNITEKLLLLEIFLIKY